MSLHRAARVRYPELPAQARLDCARARAIVSALSAMPRHSTTRRRFLQTATLGAAAIGLLGKAARSQEPAPKLLPDPPVPIPKNRPITTMWSGAVTTDGATVKAKLPPAARARLVVTPADGGAARTFDFPACPAETSIGTCRLHGLEADTAYSYRLELDGKRTSYPAGHLRTFPDGAASFRFAFASCARTGSSHAVFDTIRKAQPLFFHHLGDFHYSNIAKNNPELFRAAFETVLAAPTQAALYRAVPLVYVWDDHDFGPNGSDASAPGREASRLTYREYIPHYPLPAGPGDAAIYQTFNVGRVRFISLDLRSERSPSKSPDGPQKTLLGAAQKAWLKQELLAARDSAKLVFLISSVPWCGRAGKDDGWSAFGTERREIADFIKAHGIKNLCILSGDAHMLAADDGTNADFATGGGGAPIAVLHGSALDRSGSYKGGPYSHGWYLPKTNEGCFGLVEVRDEGTQIAVEFSGRNHLDVEKVRLNFTVPA